MSRLIEILTYRPARYVIQIIQIVWLSHSDLTQSWAECLSYGEIPYHLKSLSQIVIAIFLKQDNKINLIGIKEVNEIENELVYLQDLLNM